MSIVEAGKKETESVPVTAKNGRKRTRNNHKKMKFLPYTISTLPSVNLFQKLT
jgi:hypothetical protein